MKRFYIAGILLIVALVGAFFVFYNRGPELINDPIPSAQVYQPSSTPVVSLVATPTILTTPTNQTALPPAINLAVPFTVQAPHANWEDPYGEFCEEASVLMAASYIKGLAIPSPEFADQKLLEIKAFEERRFGYYKDTTAAETMIILKEFYGIDKVRLIEDPTAEDIKKALAEKKVVIIPAAGRELGNPYFQSPGPLYHMLVIKGYTKEGNFITNDPGTRRGADFIYSPEVIINAIHDWNGGDVSNGKKVIIVVG